MAYKHSRWQNEKISDDSYENLKILENYEGLKSVKSSEEESVFAKPPQQVGRVITALDDYLRKLQDMKLSKRDLLRTVVELCPYTWPNMHELCIYLDDQAEIWEVACEFMNSFSYRLKEYETQIEEARVGLEVYLSRQTELFNMSAEYAKMQKAGKIPKVQSNQIKFMVAESERAMALIKADTEKKLLHFKKSQIEIGKEFLDKFQETMNMTYTESLQINSMITDILGNVPSRKLNVFGQPREDVEFVLNIMEKTKAKARAASNKDDLSLLSPRNIGDTRQENKRFTASQYRNENYYQEQSYKTVNSQEQRTQTQHSTGYYTVGQDKSRAASATSPNRRNAEPTRPASASSPERQGGSYYASSSKDMPRTQQQTRTSQVQAGRQEPAGRGNKVSFNEERFKEETPERESRDRTRKNTADARERSEDETQRRLPYRSRPLQEEPRTQGNRDASPYRYMYQDLNGAEDVNFGKAAQTKHQFYEDHAMQPDKDSKKPYQRLGSDQGSSQDAKSTSTTSSKATQGSSYYRRRY